MIYKIKLNTADRISGSSYAASIPLKTSIMTTKDIQYGQLELSSPIVLSNISPVYIQSPDLAQNGSYDSHNAGDNSFLGCVPLTNVVGNTYVYQASSFNNDRFSISNPSVIQSSVIHINAVDHEGNALTGINDYSITLNFFDV